MPESKTISLLVPPETSSQQQTLQAQIQQIVSQKGHFRHVTEQSLRSENQGQKAVVDPLATSDLALEGEEVDEDETPQQRQERLWKRREEMLERLRYTSHHARLASKPQLISIVTPKMRFCVHSTSFRYSFPSNPFQPKVQCLQPSRMLCP